MMDKDILEETLDQIRSELIEIKAMMIELMQWKTDIETALNDVQSGGFLGIMGKMLSAK
jgi:hypothetical protein